MLPFLCAIRRGVDANAGVLFLLTAAAGQEFAVRTECQRRIFTLPLKSGNSIGFSQLPISRV